MPLLSQQAKKFHKKGKGKVTCSQIDSNDEFESNMPLISQWAKSDNKNDPIRNKTSKRKLEQIENSVSTSICAIQHNDSKDEFAQPKTKGCHRSKRGKCFPKKPSKSKEANIKFEDYFVSEVKDEEEIDMFSDEYMAIAHRAELYNDPKYCYFDLGVKQFILEEGH